MQIYSARGIIRGVLFGVVSTVSFLYADGVDMPAMPSMPDMPTVTAPTVDGSTYMPVNQTFGSNKSTDTGSVSASSDTVSSASDAAQASAAAAAQMTAAQAESNAVTAADLTEFNSEGLLGSVYSMLSGREGQTSFTSSTSPDGNTTALLNKILAQLSTIKTEQTASSVALQETEKKSAVSAAAASSGEPQILRFVVNGYDVRATCRSVFFSDRSIDGSFLFTGDRKYNSNGAARTETFYLLFKADGRKGFSTHYIVQPAVVQDYENKYSFLYQLAQRGGLIAERTGNLVTLRVADPTWTMDLLLDVGSDLSNGK